MSRRIIPLIFHSLFTFPLHPFLNSFTSDGNISNMCLFPSNLTRYIFCNCPLLSSPGKTVARCLLMMSFSVAFASEWCSTLQKWPYLTICFIQFSRFRFELILSGISSGVDWHASRIASRLLEFFLVDTRNPIFEFLNSLNSNSCYGFYFVFFNIVGKYSNFG